MTPNTNKPDEKSDDTIIHDLLIKHIEDWNGLKMASIQAYLQSGKVSGSLFTAIRDMLNEYATLKLHAKSEECERLRGLLKESRDTLVLCSLIDKSNVSIDMVDKIDNYK